MFKSRTIVFCFEIYWQSLSGKTLAETIPTENGNLTWDISNCRGQRYDGAASVSGHFNSLSAHILRINEEAVHTHCHTHQIDLVVAALCSIQYVRNIFYQIKELSFFFIFFESRQKMLHLSIEEHAHGRRVGVRDHYIFLNNFRQILSVNGYSNVKNTSKNIKRSKFCVKILYREFREIAKKLSFWWSIIYQLFEGYIF